MTDAREQVVEAARRIYEAHYQHADAPLTGASWDALPQAHRDHFERVAATALSASPAERGDKVSRIIAEQAPVLKRLADADTSPTRAEVERVDEAERAFLEAAYEYETQARAAGWAGKECARMVDAAYDALKAARAVKAGEG